MTDQLELADLARLPTQDPDFYASEYNNRTRVPSHPLNLARWAEWSRQVRERAGARLDLPYDGAGSLRPQDERLDYFPAYGTSSAAAAPPLLVFLHGGYWRALGKGDHSFVASVLPERGVSVAVVGYSLCPGVSIEAIVRQALGSVSWLYRQAAELGHDPARIYVGGHSAGGHLAAMMLAARWPMLDAALPADLVKGAMSISGLYDLEPIRRADFLQTDLRLSETDVARLSPAYLPPASRAPLLTAVGGLESSEYHRQNALIRAAWRANASAPRAADVPLPERDHFTALEALAEPDSPLVAALLALTGASH